MKMTKYYPKEYIKKLSDLEIPVKWCYSCNKVKPLNIDNWAYRDKTHTKFRNKCRKCTNWDSMISHRIHRIKKDLEEGLDEGTNKIC